MLSFRKSSLPMTNLCSAWLLMVCIPAAAYAEAYAVLVGLTHVDPQAYNGWDGRSGCEGCLQDVEGWRRAAVARGFKDENIIVLANRFASQEHVVNALSLQVDRMQDGDLLFMQYSGHGGSVPDQDGDEDDGMDETFVLYDGQVRDDELNRLWQKLPAGVRVLFVSDSCHSGTNMRGVPGNDRDFELAKPFSVDWTRKGMPETVSVIHLSGCRDSQTSAGFRTGGAMSMAALDALANDPADYVAWYQKYFEHFRGSSQQPQMTLINADAMSRQRPFTIARPSAPATGVPDHDESVPVVGRVDAVHEKMMPVISSAIEPLVQKIVASMIERLAARLKTRLSGGARSGPAEPKTEWSEAELHQIIIDAWPILDAGKE